MISGYIIQDLGWNWTYGICACFFGVWTLVLFLFSPETAYRRDALLNTDLGTDDRAAELIHGTEEKPITNSNVETVERADTHVTVTETRRTWVSELKIFHGRVYDDSFFKVLARPLMMLIFPQVLFSFIAYGMTTSWLIVVGSVLAQIFSAPPYNFTPSGVGLVSISTIVGSIIGAFTSGPAADWVVKMMSRRNNGVYEPEFRFVVATPDNKNANVDRLVLIVVTLVIGGMSFFGFGWSIQNRGTRAATETRNLLTYQTHGSAQSYSTACSTLQLDLLTSQSMDT
jgi:MFS family permease